MIVMAMLLGCFLILLCLLIHFHWSRYRITSHPHVEPMAIAHPSIANEIQWLVEKVANLAQIPAPKIYVFRAQHSNAFMIASTKSPHLFLSDELFEACDELGDDQGIAKLEWVICHEIAHIQHHDAYAVYAIEILRGFAQLLKLHALAHLTDQWMHSIEGRANAKANKLYALINI